MKIKDEALFRTIRSFFTLYLPKQRCLSENTIKSYRLTMNMFTEYLEIHKNIPLEKVTFDHFNSENVSEFLDWLQNTRNCSAATRNQRFMALKSFARYAGRADISQVAIQAELDKVPYQKTQPRIVEFLTENALKALLEAPGLKRKSDIRNRFLMILMYDTAARCGEMLSIRIRDFELNDKKPYVYLHGKGDKVRTVPIMGKTAAHYLAYLNEFHPVETRSRDDLLFYTVSHGNKCQMSTDNVEHFVKRYGIETQQFCSDMPERVHPHMLRHTRAIHLYRGGMPLALLAEYLGHVNIATTQVYAYADTEMKRKAIEKIYPPEKGEDAEVPIWKSNKDMIRKLYGLE